ncbi:MAG: TIGR00159 family protein [Parasporobacterium sp.]|nr:TIGR00159 family protein [Parasporobacterium sp.]
MTVWNNIVSYVSQFFTITSISVIDIIEIVIIAFIFYEVLVWFKNTRAWSLFKGIIIILIIILLAAIFNFTTILWIAGKTINVGIIALIIIFQPELRRALEQLGRKKIFRSIFRRGNTKTRFTDKTMEDLLDAVYQLSHATEPIGALICIERDISLGEYESTGIEMDSAISRQLLQQIFIDKSPLHDGAIIIRDDRIVAATCYLPMSENLTVNKKYGTRHRAALGVSEHTDAFTIIVSEETGAISFTEGGRLIEDVDLGDLKNELIRIQSVSVRGNKTFKSEKTVIAEKASVISGNNEEGGKTGDL